MVGRTTWQHMGLTIDNETEYVRMSGNENFYAKAFNFKGSTGSIISSDGIDLGNVEAGLISIGSDKNAWDLSFFTGQAKLKLTQEYKGLDCGFNLISGEKSFNLKITDSSKVSISASAGLGATCYYDEKNKEFAIGIKAITIKIKL